jgi:hypothetical protein
VTRTSSDSGQFLRLQWEEVADVGGCGLHAGLAVVPPTPATSSCCSRRKWLMSEDVGSGLASPVLVALVPPTPASSSCCSRRVWLMSEGGAGVWGLS